MKKLALTILLATIAGAVSAQPPESKTLDFVREAAPALKVYQANQKSYTWTLENDGTAVDLTGYTPFMFWATSNRASAIVTASCSVASATAGTFNATFTSADLNATLTGAAVYVYGVGVSSGGVTTARQGNFQITPDPYASGVAAVTYTTNVNWALINWINLPSYATGTPLYAYT